ncbi:ribose 5-phosphate isomerase B [Alkalispirochaeta americana]|uniref:Ribose 5-phosphate isomerase B n=1 Tax=Alkalispirochaeta americana TaxID=159291 RepID=A0A1N6VEC1_9SPIO|nr:RpiB/LacA/LacB family sugar-phosphate isomerase [Alkalispirochaeta americana]SIQ76194.1 ribose 5-phosphate isomerase B [Alkalispirochaeta americana]
MNTKKTRLAVASDRAGYPLKQALLEHLTTREDLEILDLGQDSPDEARPYVEQAPKVARALQEGRADKGVLVCGTGQGMAIVANKFKGVYAIVADTVFAGERGRIINNSNVITLGGWITAPFLGIQIVESWLALEFTQTMEDRAEWLSSAFSGVQRLEEENFA